MKNFDERAYTRYPCQGDVRLRLAGRMPDIWAQILDVSLGGCLLSFPAASDLLTGDDLELTVRVGKASFHARGWAVPWANHPDRVGVIFASMSAQARVSLSDLVGELDAAKRVKSGQSIREAAYLVER